MKAIIYKKYGPPEVLQIAEVAKPVPKDDEVLIKIHAAAVTDSDIFIMSSNVDPLLWIPFRLMIGLFKPKREIPGQVLSGEVVSAGKDIKRFKVGDKVFGLTGFGLGAFAEYKCMKEKDSTYGAIALKPANLTFEEATSAAYGGLLAFQAMEKGNIQKGQNVLIYGASGTSGTTAIQYAKYLGANVTGVCSTANLEMVKSLGAGTVIDYTRVNSIAPGIKYDFILDAVGKRRTSKLKISCKKALSPGGKYVSIDDGSLLLDSKRLERIKEVAEAGFLKPVIDRCYRFEEIAEAHRYVGLGHKKGGVAVLLKGLIIFWLSLFCAFSANAQTNFVFGKQFGSNSENSAYNPVSDKNGNVYIAGESRGAIGDGYVGKTDGFICKHDSTGNLVWIRQFGTIEEEKISWLAIDSSGNLYITGCTTGLFGDTNSGKEDLIAAKFSSDGNLLWKRQFGGDSTDVGNMIYIDVQGSVYIAGATKGIFDKSSSGGADCVVLKLDADGNLVWKKQFGTQNGDEALGITGDGINIWLCGYTFGDLAAKIKGKVDAFIVKLTEEGEVLKRFQFGTDGFDMASHITLDREKNIYIGGTSSGDFGGKNEGEGDSFLSKFNNNLDLIWTRQFGTKRWDGINGIALNEQVSENIFVSGCEHWPFCQSFIRMYGKDGELIWVNNFTAIGKNGGTCGKGISVDNNLNIYHTGNTGGNLFKAIDKPEGHDLFLIKLKM